MFSLLSVVRRPSDSDLIHTTQHRWDARDTLWQGIQEVDRVERKKNNKWARMQRDRSGGRSWAVFVAARAENWWVRKPYQIICIAVQSAEALAWHTISSKCLSQPPSIRCGALSINLLSIQQCCRRQLILISATVANSEPAIVTVFGGRDPLNWHDAKAEKNHTLWWSTNWRPSQFNLN